MGWDLNLRRPTPAGPKPAPFDPTRSTPLALVISIPNGLQQDGARKAQGLLQHCRGSSGSARGNASDKTCSRYARRVEEILSSRAGPDKSRWHITAWKCFNKWLCEKGSSSEASNTDTDYVAGVPHRQHMKPHFLTKINSEK